MKSLRCLLSYFFIVMLLTGCMKDLLTSRSNVRDFYTLSAAEFDQTSHQPLKVSLGVQRAIAGPGLNNEKIILKTQPYKIDYYANARWISELPKIVQAKIIESFENSGALPKISTANSDMKSDYLLAVEIRSFQAEYRADNAPPQIQIKIVFKLLTALDHRVVKTGEFEVRRDAPQNSIDSIMATFDQAFVTIEHDMVNAVLKQLRKENK